MNLLMFTGKISFLYATKSTSIVIDFLSSTIASNILVSERKKFYTLCREGCPNFKNKYSCPPFSPPIKTIILNYSFLSVICFKTHLSQYPNIHIFHALRACNSILKSLIDKELRLYKMQNFMVLGSGSCRACKPCGAKIGVPCKKPHRLIYSLEAVGVDVGHLVRTCFGFDLQWYTKTSVPEYTCTVGAILHNDPNFQINLSVIDPNFKTK